MRVSHLAIGLLLQGQDEGSKAYRANTIIIQGDQVSVEGRGQFDEVYLPLVVCEE